MSKSRDLINPKFPRNISDLIREGNAASRLARAKVVVFDDDRNIVECDTTDVANTKDHVYAPAAFVWVDGINRDDIEVIQEDGSVEYQHTVLAGSFLAEVKDDDTIFDGGAPQKNDVIIKSQTTAGKLEALSPAEVDAAINTAGDYTSEEFEGLKVGVCEGAAPTTGMVMIRFKLD